MGSSLIRRTYAQSCSGRLMTLYVAIGGILATTCLRIIEAVKLRLQPSAVTMHDQSRTAENALVSLSPFDPSSQIGL